MGPSVVVYTEYVNNSLLESMLFLLTKNVRISRDQKTWEFVINNDLYNLKIGAAAVEEVKAHLYEKETLGNGPFYAISISTMVNEEVNYKRIDQLLGLIEGAMPVCGVART